jgi:hypothetical protein
VLTYAFIANSEGMSPENYHWEYEDSEMRFKFFSVSGMDMTKKYAKMLADEGFEYIDLCGDFDAAMAKEIADATDGRIEVEYAKYSEAEQKKFETLEKQDEFGVIVMAEGIEEGTTKTQKITGPEYNTTIVLAGGEKAAATAAQGLVDAGISFIEMCGYFDEQKASEIIKAINCNTPVGYCG